MRIRPFPLTGTAVRLVPLALDHVPALVAAAAADRSTFGFTMVPDDEPAMTRYVEQLLADAEADAAVPFTQCDAAGRPVGCTRYLNVVWAAGRDAPSEVEIGGTWLATEVQRTAVNTEAKLLLLGHAFEQWHVHRVAICTDARNERSRRAIERLGATFEGILRRHRVSVGHAVEAGTPRDSAMYSVVREEWPAVRDGLLARLGRTAETDPRP